MELNGCDYSTNNPIFELYLTRLSCPNFHVKLLLSNVGNYEPLNNYLYIVKLLFVLYSAFSSFCLPVLLHISLSDRHCLWLTSIDNLRCDSQSINTLVLLWYLYKINIYPLLFSVLLTITFSNYVKLCLNSSCTIP
jgi:hypothetical protein